MAYVLDFEVWGKFPSKIIYETFEPLIVAQSVQFRCRQTK